MSSDIHQRVVVYRHNDGISKLAHIGIFNEVFSNGRPNTGFTLRAQIAKAKWAQQNYINGVQSTDYHESCEHTFDSGFYAMLMNTLENNWTIAVVSENETLTSAYSIREYHRKQLIEEGFIVTNSHNNKSSALHGTVGNFGWGKPIIDGRNYTQQKLYTLCEKLTIGMWFGDGVYEKVRYTVYKTLTSAKGTGIMRKGEIHAMFAAVATI